MDDVRGVANDWDKARSFLVATPSGPLVPMTLGLHRTATGRQFAIRLGAHGTIGLLSPAKVGVLLQTTTELIAEQLRLDQGGF
ncbi:hypothetical protein [Amycolatopsis magusensis]|uniref:hypothetical protein n=1 Tax=Amycolatopsis magusensis TaxID=882444 RepID=UPI0037AEF040